MSTKRREEAFQRLNEKVKRLHEEKTQLAADLVAKTRECRQREETNARLEKELEEANEFGEDLEALLLESELANSGAAAGSEALLIDGAAQRKNRLRLRRENIIAQLPAAFVWTNKGQVIRSGQVEYDSTFLSELNRRHPYTVRQVAKKLHLLCTEGPNHPSLDTKTYAEGVPSFPMRCLVSKASQEARFAWTQSGPTIGIRSIFLKGDTRLGTSEA